MLKGIFVIVLWGVSVYYFTESYKEIKRITSAVIEMLHLLRVGISEHRQSVAEIISSSGIFAEYKIEKFPDFLWENHEKLGINNELIESYNSFDKECEYADGQVCSEGIIKLEKELVYVLRDNQNQIKGKLISYLTVFSCVAAVLIIILV